MPSTDQSSRSLPHRKKCTRTANCFSSAIQAHVAHSLRALVSSRTIRRRLADGHLESRCPLRVLLLTPPIDASFWSAAAHEETGLQRNRTRLSSATNPDSISAVMIIVFACGDPWGTPQSCICFTLTHPSPRWCDGIWYHCLQYTITPSIDP
ncbi:HTH_Tnp_Tc3_2 domain-containing protein [Trichonephila clavipes]|nr:HTH_Tnp_Tc3_2 domain-containing protein [Trichonephila clavipes]